MTDPRLPFEHKQKRETGEDLGHPYSRHPQLPPRARKRGRRKAADKKLSAFCRAFRLELTQDGERGNGRDAYYLYSW